MRTRTHETRARTHMTHAVSLGLVQGLASARTHVTHATTKRYGYSISPPTHKLCLDDVIQVTSRKKSPCHCKAYTLQ